MFSKSSSQAPLTSTENMREHAEIVETSEPVLFLGWNDGATGVVNRVSATDVTSMLHNVTKTVITGDESLPDGTAALRMSQGSMLRVTSAMSTASLPFTVSLWVKTAGEGREAAVLIAGESGRTHVANFFSLSLLPDGM